MKRKIHGLLIVLFVCNISVLFCQDTTVVTPKYPELFKTVPTLNADSPKWVFLMYAEEPNVNAIRKAYEAHYRIHPFIKTLHTQNYKHFMGYVFLNHYVNDDGTIYIPTAEEEKQRRKTIRPKSITSLQKKAGNWTVIGPNQTFAGGGLVKQSRQVNAYTIDQSLSSPNVLIAGTESGAAFISIDKAENWIVTSDELSLGNRSIGAVAIDPSDENTMYIAASNSLYKSTNQGGSWIEIHNVSGLGITDISINPINPSEILTAGNQGVYKSPDGGTTWTNILPGSRCWDIERKTDDSNVVFVAKTTLSNNVVEIYKTNDITVVSPIFTAKTTGYFLPTNATAQKAGGARIAVTNANPNRLYVLLLGNDIDYATDTNFLGIYRSDNAGETWSLPYDGDGDGNPDNDPGGPYSATDWCMSCFGFGNTLTGGGTYDQGFYNAGIDVSDTDADVFLVGMLSMFKSDDGAATFVPWGGYICDGCGTGYRHPDVQEIEINGNDIWVANDGGLDLYEPVAYDLVESKIKGMSGTEYWGFGQGWQEDVLVGGRYHNGNAAYRTTYGDGKFIALGGGEAPTGYVSAAQSKIGSFSDINDKEIPETFNATVINAPINASIYPNQSIYDLKVRSEVVPDPRYGNVNYLGRDNKLWKTEDNGLSYTVVKEFGVNVTDKITDIEIPRSNPDYIYLIQYIDGGTSKLWKSTDGGSNWVEIALPSAHEYMELQVATDNEDEVYISFGHDWADGNKIFSSTDGGTNWINLTTATLDRSVRHLIIQDGTDGGLYAVTYRDVYYKNNTMADWEMYGDGLPTRRDFNKLIPFYRDNKLRAATYNRGIVETPLFEASKPIAQPIVRNNSRSCARDTVYYEDYSILKYQGASWQWDFPGASYVSSTTIRNPKVVYDTLGAYDATLTVTDASGNSDTKTVAGILDFSENLCESSDVAGGTIRLDNNNDYLSISDFNLDNVTNFTVSAWIRPSTGIQNGYSCIFYTGSDVGVLSLNYRPDNNQLGFHLNGSQWWWDSGLVVPEDQWSYVVMVVTPTNVTLYLNEKKAIRNFNSNASSLTNFIIGSYNGWGSRNFKGQIEEVAIWNRSLSQEEIRLKRHLTKENETDPDFVAYYQFNSLNNGLAFDVINGKDLLSSGTVDLLGSTAPVGGGVSQLMDITISGVKDYSAVDAKIDFATGTLPNGEVVVSKLNVAPDINPNTSVINDRYWIINNYGANSTFAALNSIEFKGIGDISSVENASGLKLFKRGSNDDTADTWSTSEIASGTTFGIDNQSVTYDTPGITSFSQFYNGVEQLLGIEGDELENENFKLYPNPLVNGNNLRFSNINEDFIFTLYDISGKEMRKIKVTSDQTKIEGLKIGVYIFHIETYSRMYSGALVIQ